MCGIIGIVGSRPVAARILEGLERLEYRGYDSAGMATVSSDSIDLRRIAGRVETLKQLVAGSPLSGQVGIGHTRWATHGKVTLCNTHPHVVGQIAVVHNGIIENFEELRNTLEPCNLRYRSQTDSEVVAHLLYLELLDDPDPERAMRSVLERLQGAFSLVIMNAGEPDMLMVARRSSPLVAGFGEDEMFVGSDARALVHLTRRLVYLEDGDWAVVRRDSIKLRDASHRPVERAVRHSKVQDEKPDPGEFPHFMAKEIHEQPEAITYTLHRYVEPAGRKLKFPEFPFDARDVPRISIVAAGTSHYAGMVARYWFESLARLSVDVDIASEFRYRDPVLASGGALLAISQSGESIDTLMALREARAGGQHVVSLVNMAESTIERESDVTLHTAAGPEYSVASTKAFTTQLVVLACLAISWGLQRGTLEATEASAALDALARVRTDLADVLADTGCWDECVNELAAARDIIYLGRGSNYPIALEGALKLKEITYIHAEGFGAGEMKHGPIALIETGTPVVVVAPHDKWFDKTASNVAEARSRGARIALISDRTGIEKLAGAATWTLPLPDSHALTAPILAAAHVQMLAYRTAVTLGTDVDRPKNLAKTVTVE